MVPSSGEQQSSIGIPGEMLEIDGNVIGGKKRSRPLRPLDEYEAASRENVEPADVGELRFALETIEVEVEHPRPLRVVFMHKRKGRAGHLRGHPVSAADGTDQRRLSGAEITPDRHTERRMGRPAELLPP